MDDIFRQAAEIKGAQMQQERRLFNSWPPYLQRTVFSPPEVDLSVPARIESALALKEKGNDLFKVGKFSESCTCYEKALSLFKYLQHKDSRWRESRKGLCDEDITIVTVLGDTASERSDVARLRMTLYQNLASSNLKAAEFKTAVQAATDAIGLQLSCPKGLFLRAQARLKAPFSGGVEVATAVADLEAACAALEAMEGQPADSAAAAAGSEGLTLTHVRAVLARVRRQQRAQAQRDARSFGGVLHNPDRPAIVEPPTSAAVPSAERAEMKTKTHLVAELERLSVLAKDMEAAGKLDEARGLLQAVERATSELEAIPAEKIDFRNPTKKMREDAVAMGLDLDDPVVINELERLQQAQMSGVDIGDFDDAADVPTLRGEDAEAAAARRVRMTKLVVYALVAVVFLWRLSSFGYVSGWNEKDL